jgi:opacity protein-like surface antigen
MRRVIKGLLVVGALAAAFAPTPARADAFIIPFIGTAFSTGPSDFISNAKNGAVTFGAALGSGGGGGIWGFDVDFGYTNKFFGDYDGNSLFTVMADLSAGPHITSSGGKGVRPYVNFGVGLVHPKYSDSVSENKFGWNAGGGIIGYFSSNLGIRGEVRYTHTVQNSDFVSTVTLKPGTFYFWRATVGLVIQ